MDNGILSWVGQNLSWAGSQLWEIPSIALSWEILYFSFLSRLKHEIEGSYSLIAPLHMKTSDKNYGELDP